MSAYIQYVADLTLIQPRSTGCDTHKAFPILTTLQVFNKIIYKYTGSHIPGLFGLCICVCVCVCVSHQCTDTVVHYTK